jgi:hypothetical protein
MLTETPFFAGGKRVTADGAILHGAFDAVLLKPFDKVAAFCDIK